MGKVKAMAMDLEELFFEEAFYVVHECESFEEFCNLMKDQHGDLVKHMTIGEVNDQLSGIWNDNLLEYI